MVPVRGFEPRSRG